MRAFRQEQAKSLRESGRRTWASEVAQEAHILSSHVSGSLGQVGEGHPDPHGELVAAVAGLTMTSPEIEVSHDLKSHFQIVDACLT